MMVGDVALACLVVQEEAEGKVLKVGAKDKKQDKMRG